MVFCIIEKLLLYSFFTIAHARNICYTTFKANFHSYNIKHSALLYVTKGYYSKYSLSIVHFRALYRHSTISHVNVTFVTENPCFYSNTQLHKEAKSSAPTKVLTFWVVAFCFAKQGGLDERQHYF